MEDLAGGDTQHRRIGLIGGIGWPSTVDYYTRINRLAASRAGGLAGADLVLRSLNFASILTAADTSGLVEEAFLDGARNLQAAGAEIIGVCSNTGHLYCKPLRNFAGLEFVPLDHVLAEVLSASKVRQAFLLGTKRPLSHPLFPNTLSIYGVEAVLPSSTAQHHLDEAIFAELEHGTVGPLTAAAFHVVQDELIERNAQHVVLACTELPLAVAQHPLPCRVWDTVELHAEALVRAAWTPKSPLP